MYQIRGDFAAIFWARRWRASCMFSCAHHAPVALVMQELQQVERLEDTAVVHERRLVAAVNEDDAIEENTRAATMLAGAPIEAAALRPAIRAGLVVADAVRMRFRHPLIRSAIVQATEADRLRDAHAALAAALPDDDDRRIWHRAAAATSHDDEVAAALADAAMRANARGASGLALEALERAAYLSADPARRGARLIDAAIMAFELGDRAALERLLARAEDADLAPIDRSRLTDFRDITPHFVWTGVDRHADYAATIDEISTRDGPAIVLRWLHMRSLRWFFSNPPRDARAPVLAAIDRLDVPDEPQIIASLALIGPVERGRHILARLDALSKASWVSPRNLHLLGTKPDVRECVGWGGHVAASTSLRPRQGAGAGAHCPGHHRRRRLHLQAAGRGRHRRTDQLYRADPRLDTHPVARVETRKEKRSARHAGKDLSPVNSADDAVTVGSALS
ncbi:hypothetical protein [Planotetraspora mira]|uniref:Uncharacterized protein n=1 Tax=Planotetraspora mira TaxID=58121 RepID=A0A8J3TX86_9ACTN|nr:hypothetical protein Pmi06nite_81750 [Planotetraspora mira]